MTVRWQQQRMQSNATRNEEKGRGAFFTPPEICSFLTSWAIRSAEDNILEPSCGDGQFLLAAVRRLEDLGSRPADAQQLQAIEIHRGSADEAERALAGVGVPIRVRTADFFDVQPSARFDAVVGNPPFIRYQSFVGGARKRAQGAALAQGVELSGLASSWAAFVVHASAFLNETGRLALVVPAELLVVNYAGPIRSFLLERFAKVRLVLFDKLVFAGVQEEVALLLAEGRGPASRLEVLRARGIDDVAVCQITTWTPQDIDGGKWTQALLPKEFSNVYAPIVRSLYFSELRTWGKAGIGMVTGNNGFFTLTSQEVIELSLAPSEVLPISPPGSKHLRGLDLKHEDWQQLADQNNSVYLFRPRGKSLSRGARDLIRAGEQAKVPTAYKCKVRQPWWLVPLVPKPQLFLTYMNHRIPRFVRNSADVHHLNTIHGVMLRDGRSNLGAQLLPIVALNSVTLLSAELIGRSYGGGVLKLEPSEADALAVPSRSVVAHSAANLKAVALEVEGLIVQSRIEEAVSIVDEILLETVMKLEADEVRTLRDARMYLESRRTGRAIR